MFVAISKKAANSDAVIYKFNIGNGATAWVNKLTCGGTCDVQRSGMTLSSDSSTLYTFFPFGTTTKVFFSSLDVATGVPGTL